MDELKKYCLDDVRLTKEVYEFGCREGKVLFTSSWDFKTYEVPVAWAKTAKELISNKNAAEHFPTSLF